MESNRSSTHLVLIVVDLQGLRGLVSLSCMLLTCCALFHEFTQIKEGSMAIKILFKRPSHQGLGGSVVSAHPSMNSLSSNLVLIFQGMHCMSTMSPLPFLGKDAF